MANEELNKYITSLVNAYNHDFPQDRVEYEHFFNPVSFRNMVQRIDLFSFMRFFPIHDSYGRFDETSKQTHQVIYKYIKLECQLIDELTEFTDKVSKENLRRITKSYYQWKKLNEN